MSETTPKAKLLQLCSTYLGGQWKDAKEEDVTVDQISEGYANQNFRCVYTGKRSEGRTPSAVVVHIFGSEMLNYDPAIKINGEVGECIIESILCRDGLAPKLLAVFPGGRIDELVPSTNLNCETARDPELFLKIAEKLAKFHSHQIPISKRTDLVQKFLGIFGEERQTETSTGQSSILFSLPLKNEHKWYEDVIRKISGRPVFVHGDCNPNNILVIESNQGTSKDVMLIDFELSSYFFRGYDIAYFFQTSRYKPGRTDGKLEFNRVAEEHSKEAKLRFLEKYLEETKKLKGHRFCPIHDSIENLQLEVELSEVYVVVCMMGWIIRLYDKIHEKSKAFGETVCAEFAEQKEQVVGKLDRWNLNHNQNCPCTI